MADDELTVNIQLYADVKVKKGEDKEGNPFEGALSPLWEEFCSGVEEGSKIGYVPFTPLKPFSKAAVHLMNTSGKTLVDITVPLFVLLREKDDLELVCFFLDVLCSFCL